MEAGFESYQWAMAAEGIKWLGSGTESQAISPENLARIEQNQKKATVIAQQIKQSKVDNRNIARFLVMILQTVNSDKLIIALHHVFFEEDTGGNTYNINDKLIAGLFAPFFANVLSDFEVDMYYTPLIDTQSVRSIDGYTDYLKRLSNAYHNNVALNQQKLTQLIIYLLKYFSIISDASEPEYKQQVLTRLLHDLFGIQNTVDITKLDF